MEIAATLNPVTYVMEAMRSLILVDFDWAVIGKGFAVVAVFVVVHAGAQRADHAQLRLTAHRVAPVTPVVASRSQRDPLPSPAACQRG